MTRPHEIKEIAEKLNLNASAFLIFGFVFLMIGLFGSPLFLGGVCIAGPFLVMGMPLIIVSREFSKLRPWTYPVVKALLGPFGLRGTQGRKKKLDSPDVLRAFGIVKEVSARDEIDHGNEV